MSLATVKQLYADLEKIAPKNPGHLADAGMIALYNANLEQARSEYPDDKILSALPTGDHGNTHLGDLLACVGQLMAVLDDGKGGTPVAHVRGGHEDPPISRKI